MLKIYVLLWLRCSRMSLGIVTLVITRTVIHIDQFIVLLIIGIRGTGSAIIAGAFLAILLLQHSLVLCTSVLEPNFHLKKKKYPVNKMCVAIFHRRKRLFPKYVHADKEHGLRENTCALLASGAHGKCEYKDKNHFNSIISFYPNLQFIKSKNDLCETDPKIVCHLLNGL